MRPPLRLVQPPHRPQAHARPRVPSGLWRGVGYGLLIELVAVGAALLIGYALGWIPLPPG